MEPATVTTMPQTMPQTIVPPSRVAMLPAEPKKGSDVHFMVAPRNVFIVTGVTLLALLCLVPVWNATALLKDANYVFWMGETVPWLMILLCGSIIFLYVLTVFAFFSYSRPQVQTEQTIMMIANIFVTLLGLALMLLSLPLTRESQLTYNNLMHRCDYSDQTHRMFEYSQVLHNIRATPDCAIKYSVEECVGYEDAPPFTSFLKTLEYQFRCSGFCYRPPPTAAPAASAAVVSSPSNATGGAAFIQQAHRLLPTKLHDSENQTTDAAPASVVVGANAQQQIHERKTSQLQTEATRAAPPRIVTGAGAAYPPTLFTDANFRASCEGMAARDIKNFAGDVGEQTFYQGIYLVIIAIATGFLKLIGFCVKRDELPKIPGTPGAVRIQ